MLRKLSLLAVVLGLLVTGPASAQDEAGRTLRDRIKSVTSKMYVKSGRLELTLLPFTSFSLNDAFYQKFGAGLGLTYHFTETLSAGLLGTYSLSTELSNASYFGRGDESIPAAGKRNFLAGLEANWAPLYGKVSLAAEYVMHFDTYITAGLAGLGNQYTKTSGDDSVNVGVAFSVGFGVRFFISRMFAIRAELKDYMIFNDKVSFGRQEKTGFQQQMMFNLGLSMFFLDGDEED